MRSPRVWQWLVVVLVLGGLIFSFWPQRSAPVAGAGNAQSPGAVAKLPVPPLSKPMVSSAPKSAEPLRSLAASVAASRASTNPAFAAFRDWAARYLAAAPADRAALLEEGIKLAQARRVIMAALIRADPEAALASAVPMVVRQQLPTEITDLLESRVSGRGNISLLGSTPLPGVTTSPALFRSALIDGQEYSAFVYGRRADQATVSATSIIGVAVDGALAVSESPLRVLEPGEIAANRPLDTICAVSGENTAVNPSTPLNLGGQPTAVEYNGKVQVLCHIAHVTELEKKLYASEVDHIQVLGDNLPGTSGVSGRPVSSWTHGPKKMLVIRVDFSDLAGTPLNTYVDNQPITPTTISNVINGANGVNNFYINSSYNQSSIQLTPPDGSGNSVDVTPVLRMPSTAASYATTNNNSQLHTDAENAATTAGYNVAGYDRVGVVFTSLASISGSQINYGGLGEVIGKNFWVNGEFDLRVVAHEVGHNYGLNHANLWQVSDGNPISPSGTSTEYGDVNDVMGSGGSFQNEFSHWNKSILQWIPDNNVALASTAGTYRIYRFDGGTATNLANPRALKIVRDSVHDYWIGFRPGDGNASLANGAYIIWGYNYNRQGELLDMTTPGTNPGGVHDEGLAIGTTFSDTVAGITIKPLAQGGSGSEQYLDVQVGFSPRIQWSQGTYTVDAQNSSATLTLNRMQSGTGAVSVNYATSNGTASTPGNYTASSGIVTWADGDLADKTVTIPLVSGSVVGTSANFTVTLSGVTGAVIGNNPAATVTMAAPGARDANFNADWVNNAVQKILTLPDGSMVLGGWFDTVYDAGFANAYTHGGVTLLSAAGHVDPNFASGTGAAGGNLNGSGYTVVFDLARQPDGKIIVAGEFTSYDGTARNRIVRLNADGTVDASFNPGTGADKTIYSVLIQPDGRIVIGGAFTNYNGTACEYLARLNSDGSLDTSFVGPDFGGTGGWQVNSLAMQADGKILVGGYFYFSGATFKASICRVLATGAIDSTFNGVTYGAHYSSGTSSIANVCRVVVQPDGKILIAGDFQAYNGTANPFAGIARLTTTGAIDSSFTPPTSSDGACNALLLLPDGRVVIGGTFTTFNGSLVSPRLARLSASGAFDSGFAAAGGFGASSYDGTGVYDLALQAGGEVLLGGSFSAFQGSSSSGPIWQLFGGLSGLPGMVQFGSSGYAGNAGTTAALSVTRTGGSLGALTVGYATVNGSAVPPDFTATSGTLTWADGDTSTKTINVPLVSDAAAPGSETFIVNLGQPLIGGTLLGTTQQASVQINYVPPPGFVTWQNAKFTASELLNANISGPNAIYGQDGLPNLVKYALGLEPKQNVTTGLPAVSVGGGQWIYTYTKPASVTDLTYVVEVSTDLVTWTSTGVTLALSSSSGGTETWQATYPTASAATIFFRLKVTQ